MKISTKGRYSLRLLLDLAEHKDKGFIPLKDIAERQDISKKYLEQIVALLNGAGILRTNRGFQGGYMLAKTPDQYTVGQILRITEGGFCPIACLEDEPNQCPRKDFCKTLPMWEGLNTLISGYLDSITLQDLLSGTFDPKEMLKDAPEDAAPKAAEEAAPKAAEETASKTAEEEAREAFAPREEEREAEQPSSSWFWGNRF